MKIHVFKMLIGFAEECGIRTLGDLQRYKREKGITSNEQLVKSLLFEQFAQNAS